MSSEICSDIFPPSCSYSCRIQTIGCRIPEFLTGKKSWEIPNRGKIHSFFFLVNLVYTYQVIRMVDCFHASIGRVEEAFSKRVVEPNVNRGSNRASNVLKAKKWNVLGLGGNRNYWDEVSIWMVKKGNETKLLANDRELPIRVPHHLKGSPQVRQVFTHVPDAGSSLRWWSQHLSTSWMAHHGHQIWGDDKTSLKSTKYLAIRHIWEDVLGGSPPSSTLKMAFAAFYVHPNSTFRPQGFTVTPQMVLVDPSKRRWTVQFWLY